MDCDLTIARSCRSKGTFDFRLSIFPGKFLKRILACAMAAKKADITFYI
jgi:hypothetical protein